MTKMEIVRAEMVKAMKAGEKQRKDCLSLLLAALKAKTIDKRAELTEEEADAVVQREIKQTRETMESAPASRTDIIEECRFKLSVLEAFAPKTMEEGEIREQIAAVLAQLGLERPTPKDKGAVMKILMPLVRGKADGALVNRLVGEILSGS